MRSVRAGRLLALLGTLAVAGPAASQEAEAPPDVDLVPVRDGGGEKDGYAVVVGVGEYGRRDIPPAPHAQRDARAVAHYLIHTLGFPPDQVRLVEGSEATKGKLEGLIEHWLPGNVGPGSTVVLYFSGHGIPSATDGSPYLLPWDADLSLLDSTALELRHVQDALGAMDARRTLVLLDACYSGIGDRSVAHQARPVIRIDTPRNEGRAITISASAPDGLAYVEEQARHGRFTYWLLRALRGTAADRDGSGSLTVRELFDFVQDGMVRAGQLANQPQAPVLSPGSRAAPPEEFVLLTKPKRWKEELRVPEPRGGTPVEADSGRPRILLLPTAKGSKKAKKSLLRAVDDALQRSLTAGDRAFVLLSPRELERSKAFARCRKGGGGAHCWAEHARGQSAGWVLESSLTAPSRKGPCQVALRLWRVGRSGDLLLDQRFDVRAPCGALAGQTLETGGTVLGRVAPVAEGDEAARTGTVRLQGFPPGTQVWVDGEYRGLVESGGSLGLDAGAHDLVLEWPGEGGAPRVRSTRRVAATAGQETVVEHEATAASPALPDSESAVVFIDSDPKGAAVTFDGRALPRPTPCQVEDVAPGPHAVSVTAPCYRPWSERLTVRAGEVRRQQAALVPACGKLQVSSVPSGATVTLDGDPVAGTTPLHRSRVPEGKHTVVVSKHLYRTAERTVKLPSGATEALHVELKPAFGALAVLSDPPGARVLLDDQEVGQTPLELPHVSSGEHFVTVRLPLHHDWTTTVRIKDGERLEKVLELQPDYGLLTVGKAAVEATVWVDGEDLGAPPITDHALRSGVHEVVVLPAESRAYRKHVEKVVVKPDERLLVAPQTPLRTGSLMVITEPPDALVLVDGKEGGRSPLTLEELPVGAREVTARAEGFSDRTERVDVEEGLRRRVRLELSRRGTLVVTSDPPGAAVTINGKAAGVAPLRLPERTAGELRVMCTLPGYVAAWEAVTVRDGAVADANCRLVSAEASREYEASLGTRRLLAWSSVGLVAAAAGLAGWQLWLAGEYQREAEGYQGSNKDDYDAAWADKERAELGGIGMAAVAGLAAGLAAYWFLTYPEPPSPGASPPAPGEEEGDDADPNER